MTEKELMHFGIPGMRWGVRRGSNKPASAPKKTKNTKKKESFLEEIKKALSDYGDEPSATPSFADKVAERRLRKKDPAAARRLRFINASKGESVVREFQLKRLAQTNPSAARAQRIRDALK